MKSREVALDQEESALEAIKTSEFWSYEDRRWWRIGVEISDEYLTASGTSSSKEKTPSKSRSLRDR